MQELRKKRAKFLLFCFPLHVMEFSCCTPIWFRSSLFSSLGLCFVAYYLTTSVSFVVESETMLCPMASWCSRPFIILCNWCFVSFVVFFFFFVGVGSLFLETKMKTWYVPPIRSSLVDQKRETSQNGEWGFFWMGCGRGRRMGVGLRSKAESF